MPIAAKDRHRYPDNWPALSRYIREERAGNRCECEGHCGADHEGGRCSAPDKTEIQRHRYKPWIWRLAPAEGYRWDWPIQCVLSVGHLDRTPEHNERANLLAMCQRCHLVYDGAEHGKRGAETRQRASRASLEAQGQGSLFGDR